MLRAHFPSEADRLAGAGLVDAGAVLRGGFTPVVRRPVGTLPSGAHVLGMADVVVLNDPLTSQGSNNAIKSAAFYLDAVTNHHGPFDADWMERTFANFWRGWAHFATRWTNDWLRPLEPHQREALTAAAELPGVAERIAAGFDDARLFDPWWYDAGATEAFLAEQRAVAAGPFDPRDLRRALGQYATGVTVVTTVHDGQLFGMTANSFTSVSLNPPLVLWAAAKSSPSLAAFEAADAFAVNVLAADQHHLSRQFSTSGADKFEGVRLVAGRRAPAARGHGRPLRLPPPARRPRPPRRRRPRGLPRRGGGLRRPGRRAPGLPLRLLPPRHQAPRPLRDPPPFRREASSPPALSACRARSGLSARPASVDNSHALRTGGNVGPWT